MNEQILLAALPSPVVNYGSHNDEEDRELIECEVQHRHRLLEPGN